MTDFTIGELFEELVNRHEHYEENRRRKVEKMSTKEILDSLVAKFIHKDTEE